MSHEHHHDHEHGDCHHDQARGGDDGGVLRDPVCGMKVTADSQHRYEHDGETYRFCSGRCREKFVADPAHYLNPDDHDANEAPAGTVFTCPMHPDVEQVGPGDCPKCGMALEPKGVPALATKTEWTCPMHPEIVRDEPGDCPICGMALEPRTVTLDEEEDNPELRDMTRRFWFAAALSLPLVAIVMIDMLPSRPISSMLPGRTRAFIELALATGSLSARVAELFRD
jgi:Cu+-exporting ATPase